MNNSFWVLYGQHTEPTFLEQAGNGQLAQRNNSLGHVKQWRNAIDVGANVGEWTRPLAEKFQQVICFEPNPNFRECFNKNITESNVTLWPYGLSDKEHTAQQDFNSTVDGFEVPVLQGAQETIRKNNPVINIEMKERKRPHIVGECRQILINLGYNCRSRVRSDEVWTK